MSAYNFLLVEQSSPNFSPNRGEVVVDFRYADPFRRYLRSKSKVVKNRAEFCKFFALPNFVGADPPEVIPSLSRLHPGTSPGNVSWGYFH